MAALFIYAGIESATAKICFDGDILVIKDRVIRERSFQVDDFRSFVFYPGELFEVEIAGGETLTFPAGAENLYELARKVAFEVSARNGPESVKWLASSPLE